MKFDFISKISKENSQNYYFCLQFDDWILLKGEKILFGKRLLKKEIMKSGLKFNFWVSANRTSNNWALVGVCACGIRMDQMVFSEKGKRSIVAKLV